MKGSAIGPMSTKRINVERVSVTSRKSLQDVLSKLDAAVGHPDIQEFWKRVGAAKTNSEMEKVIQSSLGPSGFMEVWAVRSRGSRAQRGSWRIPKSFSTRDWQSADHARNGEACARCRIVRAGHDPD